VRSGGLFSSLSRREAETRDEILVLDAATRMKLIEKRRQALEAMPTDAFRPTPSSSCSSLSLCPPRSHCCVDLPERVGLSTGIVFSAPPGPDVPTNTPTMASPPDRLAMSKLVPLMISPITTASCLDADLSVAEMSRPAPQMVANNQQASVLAVTGTTRAFG
jgi:hypothetical protein